MAGLKLPRIHNVVQAFGPMMFLSKLAGVCTIKTNKTKTGCELSTAWTACLIFIVFVSPIHLAYIPSNIIYIGRKLRGDRGTEFKFVFPMGASQEFITKLINPMIIATMTLTFRVVILLKMHRNLPEMMEAFLKVDDLVGYGRGGHERDFRFGIAMVFFVLLLSFPFQIYSLLDTFDGDLIPSLFFMSNTYNNFSTLCCEFQFLTVCFLLRARYVHLNQKLRRLLGKRSSRWKLVCVTFGVLEEKFADEVSNLRTAHELLSKLAERTNESYDVQLLLGCCTAGLNILLNLYYSIFGGFDAPDRVFWDVIENVTWSGYYFCRFVLICLFVHKLVKEVSILFREEVFKFCFSSGVGSLCTILITVRTPSYLCLIPPKLKP